MYDGQLLASYQRLVKVNWTDELETDEVKSSWTHIGQNAFHRHAKVKVRPNTDDVLRGRLNTLGNTQGTSPYGSASAGPTH